ncbi:hypothetical protein SKAU_G00083310 [Synaphobranchus kaupii]|uniref:EF-hand domain-containing protein n=1 Tax=Synaphobranchus kaupii TaxID=118154 RepID=A0A9Q1FV41_SYNKA|nr:hypothetical protein SKAU_G00083310 [Synaphobranchus kaupii]
MAVEINSWDSPEDQIDLALAVTSEKPTTASSLSKAHSVVPEQQLEKAQADVNKKTANVSPEASSEDSINNGAVSITPPDFVMGLSTLLRGSVPEKLQWTFNLYDINRDGYISKEEMTQIVSAIYDMMGKYTYPALKGDVPRATCGCFFEKMDKNKDGVVTLEEFILACQEDDTMMRSLQLFENVM